MQQKYSSLDQEHKPVANPHQVLQDVLNALFSYAQADGLSDEVPVTSTTGGAPAVAGAGPRP